MRVQTLNQFQRGVAMVISLVMLVLVSVVILVGFVVAILPTFDAATFGWINPAPVIAFGQATSISSQLATGSTRTRMSGLLA